MDFHWLGNFYQELVKGAGLTLQLLLISGVIGFFMAVLVALGRLSKNRFLSNGLRFYTSVLRGTPLLVQIYVLYYGVGSVFATFPLIRGSMFWPYLREDLWHAPLAGVAPDVDAARLADAASDIGRGKRDATQGYGAGVDRGGHRPAGDGKPGAFANITRL